MRRLGGWLRLPIGVDLGTRCAKAMQVSRSKGRWRVEAATVLQLADAQGELGGDGVGRLCDVMARQGFHGRDVVLAVPGRQLEFDLLELPPRSSGAPVQAMAQAELCRMTKLGADAFEMACWDVPAPARANPATHLMAVALRHSDAEAMLGAFEAEGLNVCGLDVQGCALARACAPRAGASGALAVLDIGWSGGLLVVMQGGVVIYQRRLTESGLAGLHGGMVKEFSLSPAVADFVLAQIGLEGQATGEHGELKQLGAPGGPIARYCDALAGEVTLSLSYIAHRYPELKSEGLLLIGGGASIPGIEQYLSQRLNRAVKRCPPVELVECPGHLADKCGSAALTTALGLAQYGKG